MHGFEQRRVAVQRVQVGRGRDADGARARGPQVGEDVSEEVGRHHHVELLWPLHEHGGEDVDVELASADVGKAFADLLQALVPERHGHIDAVGLGRRHQVLALAPGREFEGIGEHAVHARAGEHRLLDGHLAVGALEHAAPDGGIFPLGVFADHDEIDITGYAARQRAGDAAHQAHRAQVDVKVELAAHLQQQPPHRDMVRHEVWRAHGPEIDRGMVAHVVLPVGGHHQAMPQVVGA